jgi:hypothetical protein
MRMDVTAAPGIEERSPAQGVAEGVAEARLQRLDHEPGAEFVDDLFGQRGTLSNQHVAILQSWAPAI